MIWLVQPSPLDASIDFAVGMTVALVALATACVPGWLALRPWLRDARRCAVEGERGRRAPVEARPLAVLGGLGGENWIKYRHAAATKRSAGRPDPSRARRAAGR